MSAHPKASLSPAEYLALERAAEHRSEYFDGEVFAMAGASPRHVAIVSNVVGELHARLKGGPCRVFSSDLRLRVSATGLYTYPDVVVACGELRFDDELADTLLNPTVLFEVLSPSTQSYDRGEKFAHYRTLGSLDHYILLGQDPPQVEHYARQDDGRWILWETTSLDETLDLPSIDVHLPVADLYAGLDLVAAAEGSTGPRRQA